MRPRELVVSRRTDRGRLAGAVAAQVRSIGTASVVAMGPESVFVALRAIITAGEFLRRERPGKELAVALEQRSVERRGSAEEAPSWRCAWGRGEAAPAEPRGCRRRGGR